MDYFKKCINEEVYSGAKNPVSRYKIRTYNPSKNAVYLIRMYQYCSHKCSTGGCKAVYNFLAKKYYRKLFTSYNIFIHPKTHIGAGLKLPHPSGIIIGEHTAIGDNCTIYQHVTIGSKRKGDYKLKKQPKIGDGCTLFAGACVLGDITLADGTTVGCNSVLTVSTEENSTYVGVSKRVK